MCATRCCRVFPCHTLRPVTWLPPRHHFRVLLPSPSLVDGLRDAAKSHAAVSPQSAITAPTTSLRTVPLLQLHRFRALNGLSISAKTRASVDIRYGMRCVSGVFELTCCVPPR